MKTEADVLISEKEKKFITEAREWDVELFD